MFKRLARYSIIPILFALFLFQNIKLSENYHRMFRSDVSGVIWSDTRAYYEYLPALFIHNDITWRPYVDPTETGIVINKVTYGVAFFEAPFFLATCALESAKGNSYTGYEKSFGYALIISTSFYIFLGLWMLFILLKEWFSKVTAIICVLAILYGTNLFHYVYAEPGMSHVFSFFCLAGLLFFTDRFFKKPVFGLHFMAVILFGAFAVLVRPTNIIMLLIFAGYGCYTFADLKERFRFFWKNYWIVILFALAGIVVFIPQMIYWKTMTGKLFVFSYGYAGESFEFWKNPKIGEALFGRIAGWFPYSPIMFFSMLTLPVMIYRKKYHGVTILVIFILITYVCASWWATNFLCAFGYRSFIEYYPLFVIPLAYLIHSVLQKKNWYLKGFFLAFITALVYVGLRMNFSFTPFPFCIEEYWTWKDYFKLYEYYF